MKNFPVPVPRSRSLHSILPVNALAVVAACLIVLPALHAARGGDEIAAVSSRVSDDYRRAKLDNGSFQIETFAFGEGGHLSGTARDDTIDRLTFRQVASAIAPSLNAQNYRTATDPNLAKLLIMVYWGTSAGTAQDPIKFSMPPSMRDRIDFQNARLLGYDSEGMIGTDSGRNLLLTALHQRVTDLLDDIQDNRYFVVLMAYDFQLLWKDRKRKLLWETRFSIRDARNDFTLALPAMAQSASRYFGQESHGLIRRPLQENIRLGELKILGVEPDKK